MLLYDMHIACMIFWIERDTRCQKLPENAKIPLHFWSNIVWKTAITSMWFPKSTVPIDASSLQKGGFVGEDLVVQPAAFVL